MCETSINNLIEPGDWRKMIGPSGFDRPRNEAPRLERTALLDEVRGAAHELLAALEAARRQTGEWTNSSLADALVDLALSQCMARLARTDCWGRANQVPSGELWKIAGGVLESGVLQLRARAKPLGYAGDYQMLAWICEQTC